MTALEIREYRDVCKKLVEAEERDKLLKNCCLIVSKLLGFVR